MACGDGNWHLWSSYIINCRISTRYVQQQCRTGRRFFFPKLIWRNVHLIQVIILWAIHLGVTWKKSNSKMKGINWENTKLVAKFFGAGFARSSLWVWLMLPSTKLNHTEHKDPNNDLDMNALVIIEMDRITSLAWFIFVYCRFSSVYRQEKAIKQWCLQCTFSPLSLSHMNWYSINPQQRMSH